MRLTQQPLVQVLPLQQGAPGVPQTAHTEPLQTVPGPLQVLLEQQGPPALPQTRQMPVMLVLELVSHAVPGSLHATPVPDEDVAQQGWPVSPHSLQA